MTVVYASTGDHGQRYELQAFGYPFEGWHSILYSNKLSDVELAKDGILQAPDCTDARIVDRDMPSEDCKETL